MNHFGKRTAWSFVYFLIYAYLFKHFSLVANFEQQSLVFGNPYFFENYNYKQMLFSIWLEFPSFAVSLSIIWLKYSAIFPIFSSFVMPKWITLPSNGTSFWPFLLAFAMNCKENWCKVKVLALTTSSKKPFLLKAGIYILLLSPHQVVGIVSDFLLKMAKFFPDS